MLGQQILIRRSIIAPGWDARVDACLIMHVGLWESTFSRDVGVCMTNGDELGDVASRVHFLSFGAQDVV
jgi:hypothetical protein